MQNKCGINAFEMHTEYVYFTFKCLSKIDIISNRHLNDI